MFLKRKVFNSCVLPVLTYKIKTAAHSIAILSKKSFKNLKNTQRLQILGVNLKDRLKNKKIRRTSRVSDVVKRITKLKWSWAEHLARENCKEKTAHLIH